MRELAAIIQSLEKKEIELYQKLYCNCNSEESTKSVMLFNYLLNKEGATEREVIKALYPESKLPISAFSHLKKRLFNQLSVVLIAADIAEDEQSKEADYNTALRQVTRKYLVKNILIKKKVNEVVFLLGEEIYKKSKEYEIFHFWVLSLMEILSQNASKGEKYILKIGNEIEQALDYFVKYNRGDLKLWGLTPAMYLKNNEAEFIDKAKKIVATLKEYSKTTNSDFILMNYIEGQMFLAEFERKPKVALELAREKYELVTTSKALNRKGIIRASRNQLIIALINTGAYAEAENWAYNYLKEIPPQSIIVYADNAFRAALYSSNFKHCLVYLNLYEKSPRFIKDEVLTTQYYYYKAGLAFYQKNYKVVLENIAKTGWMLRDKTGWGLGVKLMEILTYIELGQTEMVLFRIKALWQLLNRNPKKNIARIKAISQMLYALLQSGFNYRKVIEKEKQKYTDLCDAEGLFYWDPTGYEITRFDWWLHEKIKRVR